MHKINNLVSGFKKSIIIINVEDYKIDAIDNMDDSPDSRTCII